MLLICQNVRKKAGTPVARSSLTTCRPQKNKNCHIIMKYYPQDLYYYYTEKKNTLKETEIKIIIKQIVNGLYFLSKNNIYHGDIKLENIMLTKKNDITKYQYTVWK